MRNVLVNLESVPLLFIIQYKYFEVRVCAAVNSLGRQIQQVDGFGPDEASEVKLQDDS